MRPLALTVLAAFVAFASSACDPPPPDAAPPPDASEAGEAYGGFTFPDAPAGDAAALDAPPTDLDVAVSPPDSACTRAIASGDLRITELMIESVAGSGDHGEWLEVQSALGCAIDLKGLHGECPRGSTVVTFDFAEHTWLAPRGSFVVADSADPAINHYLPGVVVAWVGASSDILRNGGSTITLTMNGALVDTVTYPAGVSKVGASLAFPDDCAPAKRSDFAKWKTSTSSWFPGFLGTPNAPNVDVTCP